MHRAQKGSNPNIILFYSIFLGTDCLGRRSRLGSKYYSSTTFLPLIMRTLCWHSKKRGTITHFGCVISYKYEILMLLRLSNLGMEYKTVNGSRKHGTEISGCIRCGYFFNPLNPELNPICYLLTLLGAQHFLHVSRIRVKLLTFRLLMSHIYIYIYVQQSPSREPNGRSAINP